MGAYGGEPRVREYSLETLQRVGDFTVNSGAAMAVAVDDKYDRLLVSGAWALEAYDSRNYTLIFRQRLGFTPRSAVIDDHNNLILVPSIVNGKISIFSREPLRTLGVIAIGAGNRNIFITADQTRLLASSDFWFWQLNLSKIAYSFLAP